MKISISSWVRRLLLVLMCLFVQTTVLRAADTPSRPVVDSASAIPNLVAAGQTVTYSASAHADTLDSPPRWVALYYFTFGDNSSSGWIQESSVTHSYSAYSPAIGYPILVQVCDNKGSVSLPVFSAGNIVVVQALIGTVGVIYGDDTFSACRIVTSTGGGPMGGNANTTCTPVQEGGHTIVPAVATAVDNNTIRLTTAHDFPSGTAFFTDGTPFGNSTVLGVLFNIQVSYMYRSLTAETSYKYMTEYNNP